MNEHKTSDKQETPQTDALDNEWVKRGRYEMREREMLAHARQLERKLAMMTEAHETCKRCFAEAERALFATLPTFDDALEQAAVFLEKRAYEASQLSPTREITARRIRDLAGSIRAMKKQTPYVGQKP